jgi:TatD DNase family protein
MNLVDTHCHIQSIDAEKTNGAEATTLKLWQKAGDLTAEQVIANAAAADVKQMICVGCTPSDSVLAVEFVKDRPGLFASIGIHPHEAAVYIDDTIQQAAFADLLTDKKAAKIIAIGECGLDYFYERSPRQVQEAMLRFQFELALEHDLPLIFHVREAFDDFWPIFDSYQGLRGVLHSFTDSAENLEFALERGLYIGVNGIATFAKDPAQQAVYESIPLESLLLETDAPFLTPTPYRGKICEPKHVRVTAEFLAEKRHEELRVVAKATTLNARKLFGI